VKRRPALAGVVAVVLALAAAAVAWSHQTTMVRVGGMGNACTCTHRIEP
jgi:hypothetical protein